MLNGEKRNQFAVFFPFEHDVMSCFLLGRNAVRISEDRALSVEFYRSFSSAHCRLTASSKPTAHNRNEVQVLDYDGHYFNRHSANK
jgi:hypothetical protein